MMARRFFVFVVAVIFALGMVSLAFAEATIQEMTGKILKIDGNKITILKKNGKVATGDVNTTQGLRVGDEVAFKEVDQLGGKRGFIIKGFVIEDGKLQSPGQKKGPEPHMQK